MPLKVHCGALHINYQDVFYLWNDDYRQFLVFSKLTVIGNVDYSVPGLLVADEKKKKKKEKLH